MNNNAFTRDYFSPIWLLFLNNIFLTNCIDIIKLMKKYRLINNENDKLCNNRYFYKKKNRYIYNVYFIVLNMAAQFRN